MIAIYKIISPSGKIYIGQSWEIEKRFKHYKNLHNKAQKYLYNSFIKNGVENHKFEIVHELPIDVEQEVLDRYEIFYWQCYKDLGFEMLNIKEPGSRGRHSEESKLKISIGKQGNTVCVGRILSNATKNKMRKASKGKKKTLVHAKNNGKSHEKSIIQREVNGKHIKNWSSATKAALELNLNQSHINNALKGRTQTKNYAYGYLWFYK